MLLTKKKLKKYMETNDKENTMTQNLWDAAKADRSKREVYSNSISPQVTRKISNKQSSPTLKTTRGRRTKKTQSQQKERNHKDQSRNK